MASKRSIEIRKNIQKDTLRTDIPLELLRQEWEDYARSLPIAEGIKLEEEEIGGIHCLRIYNKQCSKNQLVVYMHGGGLTEGSPVTHREFASRLVNEIGIPVVLPDYRLAPESPYPAAMEDILLVYKELLKAGYSSDNIIFGGDSSGAGLALSALLRLRDEFNPLPRKVFLISGVFNMTLSGESMRTRADIDPFTSEEVLAFCAELYASGEDLKSPYISPLYADHTGLPPILLQVGDHEILLSDSISLADKIKKSKGDVLLKIWDSMWHTWHMYPDLPEAGEAIIEIGEFLK